MHSRIFLFIVALQIAAGIWLFLSPFLFGFEELTGAALNNMVLGAVTAFLGLGASLYRVHRQERFSDMKEERVARKL